MRSTFKQCRFGKVEVYNVPRRISNELFSINFKFIVHGGPTGRGVYLQSSKIRPYSRQHRDPKNSVHLNEVSEGLPQYHHHRHHHHGGTINIPTYYLHCSARMDPILFSVGHVNEAYYHHGRFTVQYSTVHFFQEAGGVASRSVVSHSSHVSFQSELIVRSSLGEINPTKKYII